MCAAVLVSYWVFVAPPAMLAGFFNPAGAGAGAKAPPPPTPVTAIVAQPREVPIMLTALGSVQAANTVQLRARVDGTLETVNFTEGQMVKKGDVLAQLDPRFHKAALAQARAKLVQDEAQLASDLKDLERSEQLGERAFASKQSIDQQRAAVAKGRALIDADKAFMEAADTQLAYSTITAPFDGRMGLRNVDPGNIVRANDVAPIATLTQHQPVFVVFSVPENQLTAVRKASQAGTVLVTAFDPDSNQPLGAGELRVIDNQIDTTTGTLRLKAEFPNADNALWPGQFVPVSVRMSIRRDAIALPNPAIQRGPKGLFVWVAGEDRKAAMAPVQIGPVQGDSTLIESGINAGDRVIVAGQYRLKPGALVQIEEAKVSAREGGAKTGAKP